MMLELYQMKVNTIGFLVTYLLWSFIFPSTSVYASLIKKFANLSEIWKKDDHRISTPLRSRKQGYPIICGIDSFEDHYNNCGPENQNLGEDVENGELEIVDKLDDSVKQEEIKSVPENVSDGVLEIVDKTTDVVEIEHRENTPKDVNNHDSESEEDVIKLSNPEDPNSKSDIKKSNSTCTMADCNTVPYTGLTSHKYMNITTMIYWEGKTTPKIQSIPDQFLDKTTLGPITLSSSTEPPVETVPTTRPAPTKSTTYST